MIRIGIDVGGTFTDFVVYDPATGNITTFKIPSNPNNPALTILQGLNKISLDKSTQIIHGSTVATNALLERKGARTALVTTQGFKDVIQIARQNRPSLYDWSIRTAESLVPPELRLEINERVNHFGNVLIALDSSQLEDIVKLLEENQVKSVAVCLLFSFLYPHHEQIIVDKLRVSGYFVSASCEIMPEYREYERTSTTVVNAYVSPILDQYLSNLESSIPNLSMQIMQSNGGMIGLSEAKRNGARCILSGPAGGLIGAQNVADMINTDQSPYQNGQPIKLITFDMGGTSTDVSLIDGQPNLTTDASVGGCPIHLPMLDIHTIGAGGGSIAYVDPGGSLRVGPQSVGADPGPACYGKGDLPTVTDANLVLGRLIPDYFLGGQMQINPHRAYKALAKLGSSLHLNPIQTALGVIEVVNAQMERALRVISVERGHDPRDFNLFSFGGAGGLHALELARRLGIPKVVISKYAATLSAFGMLSSNIIKDYVKTVMITSAVEQVVLNNYFSPLIAKGTSEIKNEGISPAKIEIQQSLDIRYKGQSYELNIPYSDKYVTDFHNTHHLTYGYSYTGKPIEIVNLRVRAIGKVPPIRLPQIDANQKYDQPIPIEQRQVEFSQGSLSMPVYDFQTLMPDTKLMGPAILVSSDTTILVHQNDVLHCDKYQNLIIDVYPEN